MLNVKLILSALEGGMLAQNVRASLAYGSLYTIVSDTAFSSGLKKSLRRRRSEYLNAVVGGSLTFRYTREARLFHLYSSVPIHTAIRIWPYTPLIQFFQ